MRKLLSTCALAASSCLAMNQHAPITYSHPYWSAKHSSDGKRLASSFGNEISHWIAIYETRSMTHIGPAIAGDQAEFSPDSTFIWVRTHCDQDPWIVLFRTLNMQQIGAVPGYHAVFSPDSQTITIFYGAEPPAPLVTASYHTQTMQPIRSAN